MFAANPPSHPPNGGDGGHDPGDDGMEPSPFGRWFPGDESPAKNDWMVAFNADSEEIAACLQAVETGDPSALQELIAITIPIMGCMADPVLEKMPNVKRWVETADVVQDACLALWKRLKKTAPPQDPRRYVGLCAIEVYSKLLDLARTCGGSPSVKGPWRLFCEFLGRLLHQAANASGWAPCLGPKVSGNGRGERENWRVVFDCLAHQPRRAALAFMLVYVARLPRLQVANQLGVDWKTAGHALARITKAIDKAIKAQG